MSQDYNIKGNSNKSVIQDIAGNTIPLNIPNKLQSIVTPFIRIPSPTISQIGLSNLPIYTIKPGTIQDSPTEYVGLGKKIMDVVEFKVFTIDVPSIIPNDYCKKTNNNNEITLVLLDTIISVSQAKKIVITEIAGNDGSVKEFIGMGDYEINISGRFSGSYGKRPADEINNLKQVLDINKTIGITSKYLLSLNINDCVVTNYDFPQAEGEYSTQYFSINLVSDNRPENNLNIFF